MLRHFAGALCLRLADQEHHLLAPGRADYSDLVEARPRSSRRLSAVTSIFSRWNPDRIADRMAGSSSRRRGRGGFRSAVLSKMRHRRTSDRFLFLQVNLA